jgi:UDP-GlcNAc:undecaprenyl-phosphate/decaprenyl-phosphate GlcNAc-1-phosphate transferase
VEDRALLAFLIAFGATLALTPLMRRVALSSGIVDRPAARKFHSGEIPYMGGIAIAGGALIGLLARPEAAARIGALAAVGVILGLVGLLDDDRTLSVGPRLVTQIGAAVVAVVIGVRAHPTGIPLYDVAITIAFIVLITNALNLLDNMDGLAAGVGAAIAGGVFALAQFGGQDVVAALTAGICGACVGFLAFNWRPAAIFMGDAGALFLGFVLAVAVLETKPVTSAPTAFLVQLLLVGIPLLDTSTVVVSRLRHGVSVTQGGKDHLSHRLVALGLPPASAVALLIGVQLAFGGLALFAGRAVISVGVAYAAAAVIAVILLGTCARARVYPTPVVGLPPKVRLLLFLAVGGTLLVVGASGAAALVMRSDVNRARSDVERAITALRAGDTVAAQAAFTEAGAAFDNAGRVLGSPLAWPARGIPIIGSNVSAADEIIATGQSLTEAGIRLAGGVDPTRLEVQNGTVPIAEVERVAPQLSEAAALLRDSRQRLGGIDRAYLLPVVGNAIRQLEDRLDDAQVDADRVSRAAAIVPAVFGGDGTRRYFLAVQNSAELRASGGFIGNWGTLVAQDGKVSLDRFERVGTLNERATGTLVATPEYLRRYGHFSPATTWQNINMSPDFPTTGAVIAERLPQSGGPEVDGVIAIDSSGLAALLKLTGPVTVPNWPEPITADNVIDVTLRDEYTQFADNDVRATFLGDVARAVWTAATSTSLGSPQHIGEALGDASAQGHLRLWLKRDSEQEVARLVGAAGDVSVPAGDTLMLVTQNGAGNKVDYYLDRTVDYRVDLAPEANGKEAVVHGTAALTLRNGAPATGLPPVVIGPFDERFEPGENRALVSLYTPHQLEAARLDGATKGAGADQELGHRVYSTSLSIPARSEKTLALDLIGRAQLVDGWYRLTLLKQPTLRPDQLNVTISVPRAWRITNARGTTVDDAGRMATLRVGHDRDITIELHVTKRATPSIHAKLRGQG